MAGGKKSDKSAGNKSKGKDEAKGKAETGSSTSGKLKPATSINSRHILCEKHSKKEEALAKLRDGGKFDEVAREFSEDKAREGGSLGWKVRGSLDAAFEKVAYDLVRFKPNSLAVTKKSQEPSTTNNPKFGEVKTGHGYHIIMVEGRK